MSLCGFMERREQSGIDVSFELSFPKAREREPANRADFENVHVSLIGNAWTYALQGGGSRRLSKSALRMLRALEDLVMEPTRRAGTNPAVTRDEWKAECLDRGALGHGADRSRDAVFYKGSSELEDAGKVSCRKDLVWPTV